ncbi:Glycine cleavage system T protein [Parvularcula bermudensis HTCC2503]|uniref:aminomethyltransferase n=1 Tax=Parvularcula bermudensis (strain ATCC BAA-594 / HTCC2503 / KCTC 12087) TaxID=314260 RepID=E0TI74_PARBH|nr:glycine cleavage system aminomethyltransferase GcvT [Parvularcula bermudensis]ADM09413.1 Glycine cleavage system T protein [Parvularcula bermudensis HTCC2503]
MSTTKRLPLDALHRELGAKMVPFAGYEMPIQYKEGIKAEHLHVREKAGLFDVSHMGQAYLTSDRVGSEADHAKVAAAIETLVPGEISQLKRGRIRYTVLLNEEGGILDDLMITRLPTAADDGRLFLVVNAAVKSRDFDVMADRLADQARLDVLDQRALLALQGPKAHEVMASLIPQTEEMPFMSAMDAELDGLPILVSRCGYTGEDGFELSVPADQARSVAERLLDHEAVEPIGLGARDSLRLEAGLCLYGHDMNETISPVAASLSFAIGKRRRMEGGFPGAERVMAELTHGCSQVRVGLRPLGRAPAREGTEIHHNDGASIGIVTSGTFGPTVDGPIAMGYVDRDYSQPGQAVSLMIRGKAHPAEIVRLPFIEPRYFRGTAKGGKA